MRPKQIIVSNLATFNATLFFKIAQCVSNGVGWCHVMTIASSIHYFHLIKRCSLRAHYVTPGVAPSRQSAQFLPPKLGSLILRSLCTKQGWRNLGPKGTFIVSPQGWPLCIRGLNFWPQTRVFNSTLVMYQAGVVESRVHLVPILCPPCSQ